MTAEQERLYESIAHGQRSTGPQAFALVDDHGGLAGPFNAMLLAPALGEALQAVGAAIRFGGGLGDREREIAILVVAQAWDSAFERFAHEAIGRSVGLSDTELNGLRSADFTVFADGRERLVATTCLALANRGDVSDEAFVEAQAVLGLEVLFELTALVGYYGTLALQLRVFRVNAPDEQVNR